MFGRLADAAQCGLPTEAQLQRACGTLYITHGLESTCGLVMFVFFAIVAIKLHVRNHLNAPASAFLRFIAHHTYMFIEEFLTTLGTAGQMHRMNLEVRLRFCGNLDKMANATSAVLSLLGITRWLSIGNVNGMRYIGYALTCPLTQVELVVMLAPILPCYRLLAFTSFLLTFTTLTAGYVASLYWMPVWEGDPYEFIQTWDIEDLAPTDKLFAVSPALVGISILWLLVLPFLMLMYTVRGGGRNADLPQQYRFLVSLVWITWLCFPVWWYLSWEGNAIITDTKLNEVGFTVLNMTAKGLFTWQSFRVSEFHVARMASQKGARRRVVMFDLRRISEREAAGGQKPGSDTSSTSSTAADEGDLHIPWVVSRASSRKLSASKFVRVLREYDEEVMCATLSEETNRVRQIRGYGGRVLSPHARAAARETWQKKKGRWRSSSKRPRDDARRMKEHWEKHRNHY